LGLRITYSRSIKQFERNIWLSERTSAYEDEIDTSTQNGRSMLT
jgi:hypothetical protein